MNSNKEIAEKFYSSFKRRDAEGMAALYSDNARFSDPVFPDLKGEEVKGMWRMLCQNGKDLAIEYRILSSDEKKTCVEWNAHYTFSKTARKIHNCVITEMEIREGKIVRQHDSFSFWRWSRQAFGTAGWVLGWTPLLKIKVRKIAREGLSKFMSA